MLHYKILPSMILMLFITTVTASMLFLVHLQLASLVSMVGDLAANGDVGARSTSFRPMPTVTMPELTLDMAINIQPTVAPVLSAVQAPPTPSPTPILATASVRSGVVNQDLVNVRSYPNLAGEVISQIRQGEHLEILAVSPDGLWLRVCCPRGTSEENSQSWIAREFVAINP